MIRRRDERSADRGRPHREVDRGRQQDRAHAAVSTGDLHCDDQASAAYQVDDPAADARAGLVAGMIAAGIAKLRELLTRLLPRLVRDFDLVALVIDNHGRLEPSDVWLAEGDCGNRIFPRTTVTRLRRFAVAAVAVVVVEKLLADETWNFLKTRRNGFVVFAPFLAGHFGRQLERNYSCDTDASCGLLDKSTANPQRKAPASNGTGRG